jgi:glycolate oxidase FAD binding subunit
LSVTPTKGAEVVREIAGAGGVEVYYDWGGGLIWLAAAGDDEQSVSVQERRIRAAAAKAGGHALLMRASEPARRAVPVFQPQAPAAAELTLRLKESFDPRRVLNPGRMYRGL